MRNITKNLAMTIAGAALVFGLGSCAKEGPQGPAGKNGTNGADGNANVKNKTIFVKGSDWSFSAGKATNTILVPEITADIVSKGAVMVYGGENGNFDALPFTAADGTSGVVLAFGYGIEAGKLNLYVTWNTSVTLTAADIGDMDFKIVTIAGSDKAQKNNSFVETLRNTNM